MTISFEGFDFFLSQVKHNLKSVTAYAFENLMLQYHDLIMEVDKHLVQAARQYEAEHEKAQFIAAIEQCQRLKPQLINAFGINLMEALRPMNGQDPAGALMLHSSIDALATQAREDEVYLKNMTDQAADKYAEWNKRITSALQHVLPRSGLTNENNPLSPIVIGNAIYASLKITSMHSSVKKEVYVMFAKNFFNQMDTFYQGALQHMAEAGLSIEAPSAGISDDIPTIAPVSMELDTIESDFNEILTEGVIPPSYDKLDHIPMEFVHANDSKINTIILTVDEIDELLSTLQKGYEPKSDGTLSEYIRKQLALEEKEGEYHAIRKHDENVVNLLAFTFEQIAETQDEKIAELFRRLQVPFTRMILTDDLFFHDSHHPARELLDKLIELTFSSIDEELLFKQVQNTVTKVLLKYKGELKLFHDLAESVNGFIESNLVPFNQNRESMTLQFEAAENLRMAKTAASKLISKRTDQLPRQLRFHVLIEKIWEQTLAEVYLHAGTDSKEWKLALYMLDAVLTLTDGSNKDKFQKHTADLPKLVKALSQYFSNHNIDNEWKTIFLNQLQEIQVKIHRGTPLSDIDDDDLEHTFDVDMIIDDYESEMMADMDTSTIGFEHKSADTIVPPGQKPDQDKAEFFVKHLKLNQWMNFLVDGKRTPCFLSYYSKLKETYIFCDRHNNKLFEREKNEIIRDLMSGYASALDKTTNLEGTLATVLARVNPLNR